MTDMMDKRASAVSSEVSEVYVLRGTAKGKLVAMSIQVSINLKWRLDFGKGPTMSMANFSKRSTMSSGSQRGTLVPPLLLHF